MKNFNKEWLRLYAVTDRTWLGDETLYEQVEKALRGGATMVQIREKELDEAHFEEEARQIQMLCRSYQVPLIINDNVALAKRIDADGVHIGQSDMEMQKGDPWRGQDHWRDSKNCGAGARSGSGRRGLLRQRSRLRQQYEDRCEADGSRFACGDLCERNDSGCGNRRNYGGQCHAAEWARDGRGCRSQWHFCMF